MRTGEKNDKPWRIYGLENGKVHIDDRFGTYE